MESWIFFYISVWTKIQDFIMSPRPLKTVLDALSKVEYIKPLKNAYALDHLGLKFKQNIIKSIKCGRTDLSRPLTNCEDYETELSKIRSPKSPTG